MKRNKTTLNTFILFNSDVSVQCHEWIYHIKKNEDDSSNSTTYKVGIKNIILKKKRLKINFEQKKKRETRLILLNIIKQIKTKNN